jgi:heptosyltransferase-2
MDPKKIKKALIIQTAYIGDVILTTPVIDVLHSSLPEIEIDFLTIPKSSIILKYNPFLNKTIIFDKKKKDKGLSGLWRLGKLLYNKHYDLCIVPHRSFRSAVLALMTRASIRIGFNRSSFKKVFTDIVPYNQNIHEIERNLSLLRAVGIQGQRMFPVIHASKDDQLVIRNLWQDMGFKEKDKVIAIAPGSVWPTKRWPDDYFAELCQRLKVDGFKVVLVGSREDISLCEKISINSEKTSSIAGETTLTQTFEFFKLCAGVVTNDSAPLHLGMAAQIPVFAIFGPTVPAFGFGPFGENSIIFENDNLNCRPCSIHGGKKCPIKTFECMVSVMPDRLSEKIRSFYI